MCPHADAAPEPGESMPSMDSSLLRSVIPAEYGLGHKPMQGGGEAQTGSCGMAAIRQEDAEPGFPPAGGFPSALWQGTSCWRKSTLACWLNARSWCMAQTRSSPKWGSPCALD